MNVPRRSQPVAAFTLVELLVSTAIMLLLLVLLVSMSDATQKTWKYTRGKIEQFQEARKGFESLTRRISQATLNTYWDYDTPTAPTRYLRQSELRFICGPNLAGNAGSSPPRPGSAIFFQAPLGFVDPSATNASPDLLQLSGLLNTWGFFLEFNDDSQLRPAFLKTPPRYRFRLMEMMEPSESLSVYQYTSGLNSSGALNSSVYTGKSWFTGPLNSGNVAKRAIAENIVALIFLPKLSPTDQTAGGFTDASLAPNYTYDSTDQSQSDPRLNPRNQLPPVIQVTMVAVDETTYARLQGTDTAMPDLGLDTLFQNASSYEQDMKTLEKNLQDKKLSYRIFSTNVAIKAAKWSRAQVK